MLAVILVAVMVESQLVRYANFYHWITPTNTLIHLDGIAMGSLLALGLHTLALSRRLWLWIGLAGMIVGFGAAATIAAGTSFLDSALAVMFGGAVLAAIASTGSRNPLNTALAFGPLAFYGRISYGMYMTHIMVFIYFGWFDLRMAPYGVAGSLAVVAFRLAAATAVATALWYGFESRILKLKRYF
jgi:peptidoglycan/LPS O-acetylase OafA/YrhL